jgi:hypothetical protein
MLVLCCAIQLPLIIVFRTFNLKRSIHKGGEEVSEVVGTLELMLRSKES